MLITQSVLSALTLEADASPRRRKNRNFHASSDAPAHRLLNALEPDSYVRPHCHKDASKDETIIALRGRFGVVFFDAAGAVIEHAVIAPAGECVGVDIEHGSFHSIVALEGGSVFFECKAGPYAALSPDELAPWAPAEGDGAVPAYLAKLRALFA
jgi:cupin fold WbuC family metalloprotein